MFFVRQGMCNTRDVGMVVAVNVCCSRRDPWATVVLPRSVPDGKPFR